MRELRCGRMEDLEAIAVLEALCFPPTEAADRETLAGRLAAYPGHFRLLLEDGELLSFVDGFSTDEPDLRDEMYADPGLHRETGGWEMIFGVNTHPAHRGRGLASLVLGRVIEEARSSGKLGLVLTCKEGLVPFYARLGFRDEGITAKSFHGGASWHQMRLRFGEGA